MAHVAKVQARILPDGFTKPVWARGNGDTVFKAMAMTTDAKLDKAGKANKLQNKDGTPLKDPSEFPNRGRFIMTLANLLRGANKDREVIVGKYTLPVAGAPSKELDADFEKAQEAAESYKVKAENARIAAANAKKAEKAKAPAKAKDADKAPAKAPAANKAAAPSARKPAATKTRKAKAAETAPAA